MQFSHPQPRSRTARQAFTLVELLAVIFIIAILTTLILVAVHHAQRSSRITKTRADLAAITTALEQYHADFRTYPMAEPAPTAPPTRTILAQALIGPGPATEDGADGPGFRVVIDPNSRAYDPNAKKWDAYLSPDHFKVQRFANGWAILDFFGNPIRYYPKRRSLNPNSPNSLVDARSGVLPGLCIFDARDGENPQTGALELNVDSLQVVLGDDNNNNLIDGNESLRIEGGFMLASPGPDGIFTTFSKGENKDLRRQKSTKSDDIFNFEQK